MDVDGDNLPDWWERTHFGDITLYDSLSDPDGDGLTNLQEYNEQTNPTLPEPAPTQVSGIIASLVRPKIR